MLRVTGTGGNTKARQAETKMSAHDTYLDPWPGKFPQKDTFRRGRYKGVQMGADGSRWIQMGAKGRMCTGSTQNKTITTKMRVCGDIFTFMVRGKNPRNLHG